MDFYIIDKKTFTSSFSVAEKAEPIIYADPDYCNKCKKPMSMKKWLPPYRVILENQIYGDFIYGSFTEMLASEKFMSAYKKSSLKGIADFHLVKIVKIRHKKKNDLKPPQYYKIQIIRTETLIDEKLSSFEREFDFGQTYCETCRIGGVINSFNGIFLIESTWTGEDIFYAKGLPGEIIVTQDFVDFASNCKFTNIDFVKAIKYRPLWAGGQVKT